MALYFKNQYPETIYVALSYGWIYDRHYIFIKQGWWAVATGQTSLITNDPLTAVASRYWYFYAQSRDGNAHWSGPTLIHVTNKVFEQEVFDNTGDNLEFGFRELDTNGYDTFTLIFVP